MTNYYDLVLGVIPVALLGISAVLLTAGFDLTTAVPLASSVPVLVIGHAMFVRTPTDQSVADATRTETSIDVHAD